MGLKGNPKLNRNLDTDVIVSEVRETSRKPDELYGIIERIFPGGRKIELFARPHNRRAGWLALGNQLPGNYVYEEDVIKRWNQKYPSTPLLVAEMEKQRLREIEDDNKEAKIEDPEDLS